MKKDWSLRKNGFTGKTGVALAALFLIPIACAEPGHQFPPIKPEERVRIIAALPPEPSSHPKKPRKLLVFFLALGYVHESIPYGNEALRELGDRTGAYEVDFSDDMAVFTAENLRQYDAVLFNNTSKLKFEDPAARAALIGFLREGKGFIGLHAASDSFSTWPEGQELLGGAFANHPWDSERVSAVKLDDPDHVLTKAFHGQGFWIRDEIYQIVGPYGRDRQRVLLSLDMSKPQNQANQSMIKRADNDFPISWVKQLPEGGRVFYSSLGHNPNIFYQPQVMRHFIDGIQYALGDLEADAAPSSTLQPLPQAALAPDTPAPLNGAAGK